MRITVSNWNYRKTLKSNLAPFKSFKSGLTASVIFTMLTSITQAAIADEQNQTQLKQIGQNRLVLAKQGPLGFTSLNAIKSNQAKIQVAILLDTSGSMDGLINQTRNQLWQVVNEFSSTKKNGQTPILEVALFEYGNASNSKNDGFVRQLNSLTRELDIVSQGLFSLTTNGGNEYCGLAIQTAVNNLQWSQSNNDIKTIFIAGNEPFTQGPINYKTAVKLAREKGISVNTIHAGDHQKGIQGGWQAGALLADGDYMSINADQRVVHIVAPQDQKIADLNAKLNQTYLPYGGQGKVSVKRQSEQDSLSSNISPGLLAKRAQSKSSAFYNNSSWDLVDAIKGGKVAAQELEKMDERSLPKPMIGMSNQEKVSYIEIKAVQRQKIQKEIKSLSKARSVFVAKEKRQQLAAKPSMSDALTQSIKKQVKLKGFDIEDRN